MDGIVWVYNHHTPVDDAFTLVIDISEYKGDVTLTKLGVILVTPNGEVGKLEFFPWSSVRSVDILDENVMVEDLTGIFQGL